MIAWIAAAFSFAMLAAHVATTVIVSMRYRRPRRNRSKIGNPAVTLLRPVRGIDPFDAETLRSSFTLDYPDYEVIFCAQTLDDPAIAMVEKLIAEHTTVKARLLVGEAPHFRNPKLKNVAKGWTASANDWICMADCNLLLPTDYLSEVTAAWGHDTAVVSSPPTGTRPEGFSGHLECAFLNSNQARLQLAIDSLGHGFTQGKTMFFNRPLMEAMGGLRALDKLMAEDVNATKLIRSHGFRISLTQTPFEQPIGRRRFRQVWDRQVRWAQVRREGFPLMFMAEPLNGALVPILSAAAASSIMEWSILVVLSFAAIWYGSEFMLARTARWPSALSDVVLMPVRDILLPAIWLVALTRNGFDWRGNRIEALEQMAR